MKQLKQLAAWLMAPLYKWKRNALMSKAQIQLKRAVDQQVEHRQILRVEINRFLKDYFGIDANSKYIPKDFKNAAEVKAAIITKFQPEMDRLHVKYEDLFR